MEECRLWTCKNRVKIGHKREEQLDDGGKCIRRSLIIYTPYQILIETKMEEDELVQAHNVHGSKAKFI